MFITKRYLRLSESRRPPQWGGGELRLAQGSCMSSAVGEPRRLPFENGIRRYARAANALASSEYARSFACERGAFIEGSSAGSTSVRP